MFTFHRKRRIKVKLLPLAFGGYEASATNGRMTVYQCYGSTKEAAIEMALWRFKEFYNDHSDTDDTNTSLPPKVKMRVY